MLTAVSVEGFVEIYAEGLYPCLGRETVKNLTIISIRRIFSI